MNLILFDDVFSDNLLPLNYTRPVSEIRIGIMTIREKWEKVLNTKASYATKDYLSIKFKINIADDNLLVNASVCPNPDLLKEIDALSFNQKLFENGKLLAIKIKGDQLVKFIEANDGSMKNQLSYLLQKSNSEKLMTKSSNIIIDNVWDVFSKNGISLEADFEILTQGRKSHKLNKTNQVIGGGKIFLEEGVKADCAVFNTTSGSIYLGKGSEVMEGSLIRGPFALCDYSGLKMGTKIYGPTTVGPYSKVGGEVNNSVIFGYSNKGHDGFLGNSVIGEWCNLGADTNNSNLKNNYGEVQLWNYNEEKYINSHLQFCGLIMGDHSKCGINTMFNTGSVIGVNVNIFGSGFPDKHVPSFSWGGADGFKTYTPEKAYEVAERVFERRNKDFDQNEKEILSHVFKLTSKYRVDYK